MKFDIIRLAFTSPLHISTGGNFYDKGESMLHSDTIYSAVIQQLSSFEPEIASNPEGFTFSSAFPFGVIDQEHIEYFFPKPATEAYKNLEKSSANPKVIKKIKWVNMDIFQEVLWGKEIKNNSMESIRGEFLSLNSKIKGDLIKKETQLRISVPQEIGDPDVYYIEKTFFQKGAGLYFLCVFENEEIKGKIIKALELLELSGIGTDRSIGMGQFKLSIDTIELSLPKHTPYSLNISLFLPNSIEQFENMIDDKCEYELVKRGGWITDLGFSTYRKNMVYMFQEGGIFKTGSNSLLQGGYIDVKPKNVPKPIEHPVWRVGRSIFLPIKI